MDSVAATLRFAVELFILIVRERSRIVVCDPEYANSGAEDCEVTPDTDSVADTLKFSSPPSTLLPFESTSVRQRDALGWLAAAPPNRTPGKETLPFLGSTGKTLAVVSEYAGSELAPRSVPTGSRSINSAEEAVDTVTLSNSKPPRGAVKRTRAKPVS